MWMGQYLIIIYSCPGKFPVPSIFEYGVSKPGLIPADVHILWQKYNFMRTMNAEFPTTVGLIKCGIPAGKIQ